DSIFQTAKPPPRDASRRFLHMNAWTARRSVNADAVTRSKAGDLILHQQFFTLEFRDLQIVGRRVEHRVVDFPFEGLVSPFQFRKVRLHRHVEMSPQSVSTCTV